MIVLNTGGLKNEFSSLADLAEHFRKMSVFEFSAAGMSRTQKETRYHEGRASALQDVSELLKNATVI